MQSAPSRDEPLGRGLKRSLIAHGVIALVIAAKSIILPGEPLSIAPTLRVDMVGLPDILKKDLSQVSKALPKQDVQEQLKEAEKQAKAVKPVPVPKEEPAAKDEMVLNPKKIEKKEEKKDDVQREKKLQSALSRIRAMEKLKDRDDDIRPSDEDAVIVKGNAISKGTSLNGEAREQAEAGYYDVLRDRLAESWSLPPYLARQKLAAQVLITIDGAGNVLSVKFVKPSGNEQFDEAIRTTLRDSSPLPKPPAKVADTVLGRGVLIGFPL